MKNSSVRIVLSEKTEHTEKQKRQNSTTCQICQNSWIWIIPFYTRIVDTPICPEFVTYNLVATE